MNDRVLVLPLLLGLGLIARPPVTAPDDEPFLPSDRCIACHKGVSTSAGEDVSIGYDWRASMMANSGRDPYWQAAVRREITDHPQARAAIEDRCSRCHMPMPNELDREAGSSGAVFANLPGGEREARNWALATDGVSCSVCHQIQPANLGSEESFDGEWEVERDPASGRAPDDPRPIFGPFEPDVGGAGIMHSATGFRPTEGTHVQSPELCGSCHTLFTHAVRSEGEGPEFPEQVPYLEWQASSFPASGRTCQSCHMPEVGEDVPVTGVLGRARPNVSRHVFRGGNFFMLRVLNRYRNELGVVALPQELQLSAQRAVEHLQTLTAAISIEDATSDGGELRFDVALQNLSGHKFPTAYPSRRAWLHVTVRDAGGALVFESGAFQPDGSIAGNDNDDDATRYEPHYTEITEPGEVQIYEAVMVDDAGAVTTGLLQADHWVKDNRLLPDGFDPSGSERRIGVYGAAGRDDTFVAGGDRVRYRIPTSSGVRAPYSVTAELWFQPIGYRWARNLDGYDTFETNRFVRYFREMATASGVRMVSASEVVR